MKLPFIFALMLLPLLPACAGQPTGVALGLGTHGGGVAVYTDSAYYTPSHAGVYLGLPVYGGGVWERGSVSPRVERPVAAAQAQVPLPAASATPVSAPVAEAPATPLRAAPAGPEAQPAPHALPGRPPDPAEDMLPMAVVSRQAWSRLEREYAVPLTLGHLRLPAARR